MRKSLWQATFSIFFLLSHGYTHSSFTRNCSSSWFVFRLASQIMCLLWCQALAWAQYVIFTSCSHDWTMMRHSPKNICVCSDTCLCTWFPFSEAHSFFLMGQSPLLEAGCLCPTVLISGANFTTIHTLKGTPLSWCAKWKLDLDCRAILSHYAADKSSVECYSRDNLAKPLREFEFVLQQIRTSAFSPGIRPPGPSVPGLHLLLTDWIDESPLFCRNYVGLSFTNVHSHNVLAKIEAFDEFPDVGGWLVLHTIWWTNWSTMSIDSGKGHMPKYLPVPLDKLQDAGASTENYSLIVLPRWWGAANEEWVSWPAPGWVWPGPYWRSQQALCVPKASETKRLVWPTDRRRLS